MAGLTQSTAPVCEPVALAEAALHIKQDSSADDTWLERAIAAARGYVEGATNIQMVCATWQLKYDYFPALMRLPRRPLVSVTSITYVDSNGDTQTVDSDDYTLNTDAFQPTIEPAYSESWPTPRAHANSVVVTFVAGYAAKFTANATTDKCTFSGRSFADADKVRLSNSGGASGALPTGLSSYTDYYVIEQSGSTCELAATEGGTKIDIEDTGTGTHFMGVVPEGIRLAMLLLIRHWDANRSAVLTGTISKKIEYAVNDLLGMDAMTTF